MDLFEYRHSLFRIIEYPGSWLPLHLFNSAMPELTFVRIANTHRENKFPEFHG